MLRRILTLQQFDWAQQDEPLHFSLQYSSPIGQISCQDINRENKVSVWLYRTALIFVSSDYKNDVLYVVG